MSQNQVKITYGLKIETSSQTSSNKRKESSLKSDQMNKKVKQILGERSSEIDNGI